MQCTSYLANHNARKKPFFQQKMPELCNNATQSCLHFYSTAELLLYDGILRSRVQTLTCVLILSVSDDFVAIRVLRF